jgi:hypothetical protein
MWLACHTQEEIAETEDVDQTTVMAKIRDFMDFGKLAKIHKTHADYLDDFEPPIYNVWKRQNKTSGVDQYQVVFSTAPEQYQHDTGHSLDSALVWR